MRIVRKHELLGAIASFIPENPIIVEAGAFNGQDTKKLAHYWPHGIIHAFEPVPEIFALLEQATSSLPNVQRYPYALSDHNGTATFYVSEKPTAPGMPFQAGSLHKPTGRLGWSPIIYPRTMTVSTITLDTWAIKHALSCIDLLWLDVQGHALPILQASPHILSTIRCLYLEVEFKQAYERQALYPEIVTWLANQGFQEEAHDFENQDRWFYGNVLFVR